VHASAEPKTEATTTTEKAAAPNRNTRATSAKPARRGGLGGRRQTGVGLLMVAPDALGLLIFVVIPMILAIVFSFFAIDGFGNYSFNGLANYRRLFADPQFWSSLGVSGLFMVVFVPAVFVVGLLLALLLRDAFPGLAFVRTALFTPYVVSLVVIGIMWKFLLSEKVGFATSVLNHLGLGQQSWLGDPNLALWSLIAISVWVYSGYYMVLFLAGLADIPRDYYEAASLDGAGPWRKFRSITWPLLRPTSFFVGVTSVIAAVAGPQAFDLVFVTTKGGPNNSTQTIVTYIYMQAFQFGDFGYASALASVLVLLLLIVTGALFAVTRGGRFNER
jgi:multiple sugar transport system permease protein